MRIVFIGILVASVLSACSSFGTSIGSPIDTPIPFTPTPEPPLMVTPLPTPSIEIEYASVAEALVGLKSRDDVYIEILQGWTIVREANGSTNWSFPPSDHPAFPAVAKRVLYRDQNGWHLEMDILCEAEPAACDEFVRYFEMVNEPMYQYIEQQQKP